MVKLIKHFILFILPFFVVAFINLKIDNANIFSSDKSYREIGKVLASGKNIANLYNFNEFLTRKYTLKLKQKSPQVICIGSSRFMQFNSSLFSGEFFNSSVSNISLKEIIATYNVYRELSFYPDTIIIGLDPKMFTGRHNIIRSQFVNDYLIMTSILNVEENISMPSKTEKYFQLINPIYFYNNLKFGKKEIIITDSLYTQHNLISYDGSLVYNSKIRNRSITDVENEVTNYFERFSIDYKNAQDDEDLYSLFGLFLSYLKNNDHHVIIVMPPYHPSITSNFNLQEYSVINDVERNINSLWKYEFDITGSFNPENYYCPFNGEDFYDAVHPKRSSIYKLLSPSCNLNED